MALYNETVMEHFMNPHNVGEIENPDGKGTYGSPVCGDMMQITIKVDEEEEVDVEVDEENGTTEVKETTTTEVETNIETTVTEDNGMEM